MHSSLIGKVEKANRYARELDRITIDRLSLTFRGDNDTHHVGLDAGQWHCTCHYFESWGSCVHLLTLQKVLGVMLPEEAQVSIFAVRAGRRDRLGTRATGRARQGQRSQVTAAPVAGAMVGVATERQPAAAACTLSVTEPSARSQATASR